MTSIPWNRINTGLLLLVLLAIIGLFASRAYGGPLDPGGPPSATGTLPQVEPRSPIPPVGWNGTFPIVISQPGSYFLTRSLTGLASTDGIHVTADDVSIDLNGFTLDGVAQQGLTAIDAGTTQNLRIANGVIRGWGGGIYGKGAGGFFYRLQLSGNGFGVLLGDGSTLDDSSLRSNGVAVSCACGLADAGVRIAHNTFFGNNLSIQAGERWLLESNQIDVPAGQTGINVTASFVTIRDNVISNPALSGYVPISFNSHTNTAVIRNRVKAGLSVGDDLGGNVMPYDTANALTNLSP